MGVRGYRLSDTDTRLRARHGAFRITPICLTGRGGIAMSRCVLTSELGMNLGHLGGLLPIRNRALGPTGLPHWVTRGTSILREQSVGTARSNPILDIQNSSETT